jgi:hypothetical protein
MTKEHFLRYTNEMRLANKNKWFIIEYLVDGKLVAVKNYNTYLQIYKVDGVRKDSGTMEMSVTAWKKELEAGL